MIETDPLVSTEEEVEADATASAAIKRGIRDAEEDRAVPASRIRELLSDWKEEFSTPMKR